MILQLSPWIPVIAWMAAVIIIPAMMAISVMVIWRRIKGNRIHFVTLKLDNSATIRKKKTKGNKIQAARNWKPTFSPKAVFPVQKRVMLVFQRTLRFIFCIEGEDKCLEMDKVTGTVMGTSWTMKELVDYIGKVVHLAAVKDRPFTNMQMYLLAALVIGSLIMNMLILRRIGV